MQCTNCNAQITLGDRFCGECGTPLDTSNTTAKGTEELAAGTQKSFAGESAFALPQKELRRLLGQVQHAMGPPERGPVHGVYLAIEGGMLTLVATDGHRLAIATCAVDIKHGKGVEAILPRHAVINLTERLAHRDTPVVMSLSAREVRVEFDGEIVVSELVPGKFPDYRLVVPKNNSNILRIARKPFAVLLQRVVGLRGAGGGTVQLALSGSQLLLSCSDAEFGDRQEEMTVSYRGQVLRVGFNPWYLLDTLTALECEEVEIAFGNPLNAAILKIPGQDDFKCVLMPVKL